MEVVLGGICLSDKRDRGGAGKTRFVGFARPESLSAQVRADAVEDGFEKTTGKKGRKTSVFGHNNDPFHLRSVRSTKPDTERSFSVPVDEIRDNSYKLSLSSDRSDRAEELSRWRPLGEVCDVVLDGAALSRGRPSRTSKTGHVAKTERTITQAAIDDSLGD